MVGDHLQTFRTKKRNMDRNDITARGCLTRFAIILVAEFLTVWICVRLFGLDEGMTLLAVIIVFAIIMTLALKYDKNANPYSIKNHKEGKTNIQDNSVVCPFCYHINSVVDDDGYCLCEKCKAYFQVQEYDPE